jgi:hypothetical protein
MMKDRLYEYWEEWLNKSSNFRFEDLAAPQVEAVALHP